jgi:hypothetical protein
VERLGLDENGEEAEFEWPCVVEGGGEEDFEKGVQRGEEVMVGRSTKKQKRYEAESKWERMDEFDGGVRNGVISWKEQVQNMSNEEFETFLRVKAKEISNMVVDEVIGEVADKVMEEKEEDLQGKVVVGEESVCCPVATRTGRWLTGLWRLRLFLRLARDRPGRARGCSVPGMSMSWLRPRSRLLRRT